MPQVSLTTSTNFNGLNALVENQNNTITFRFDLDEAAPAGGLRVFVDSDVVQIVNRLDLPGFAFNPVAENINPATFATDFDNSGFAVTINEGATSGSFTIPIFDNTEPDTFLPATFDGLVQATFSVKTAGEVAAIDASNIAGVGEYTVNSGSAASAVLFADDASQLPVVTPPTFSITASETVLVEDEGTTTTFTIQLVDGTIPDDGQVINIGTGVEFGLGDFLVSPFQGAVFENVVPVQGFADSSGLSLRVTDSTAKITLPIFDDGDQPSDDPNARNEDAGVEQVTFSLLAGDGYSVAGNQGSVELTLADTRSQLSPPPSEPVVSFSVAPTTISEAEGTALVMNFSVTGDIPEGGITVKLEGDAARIMQQFTVAQTRFDSETGEIFYRFDNGFANNTNGNIVGGTLERFSLEDGDPSEAASNPEAAGDAFLSDFTFTITEANASITIPVFDDLIEEADATYTYTLVDGDGYAVDGNANSGTFTVTDGVVGGVGPTVGVSGTPTTLIESQQTALTLTFTTQGDIPPEGLVVVLEGAPRAIAEFDVNATNPRLPESETVVTGPVVNGGNIVGTDETAGSLFFRITDPTATITVPVFQDEVEEGSETLNFNLLDGELYNVDQAANAVSVTIEDKVEPVVSFSVEPTTISEAEGTALVMNFSVTGDIPSEGITVKLEGDAARIMQQFTVAQTRFDSETGEIFYRFDNGFANNTNGNIVGGTLERFSLEDGDPNEAASNPEAAGDAFLSDFTFTITEANASITIPVFDDLIEEADATYTYNLVDGDGYKVDDSTNSGTFTVTDGVVGGVGPTVGVSGTPTTLIESEQTALTLTFTTQGDIPPEGIVVVLEGAPRAIAEFDVNATNPRLPESETVVTGPVVNGGNIVGTNEVAGALFFRITDPTATITVPVFQDEVEEGSETLNFNLRDGELYNVDQAANTISVTINDTPEPVVSFSITPTIISEAEGTALVMNFSVTGDIPPEGITVKLEGDAARIMQQFTVAQTRFDSETGEIFYRFDNGFANNTNGNIVGGTLERFSLEDGDPSEAASNPEAAGDAFLSNFTFTITEPNASITIPVFDDLIEEADATYTYNLVNGDGYLVDSSANSGTFTVTDGVVGGVGPTVGVSGTPTTLIESEQTALTLTFTTQGDIPPEGLVVILEGTPRAIAEFDVNATNPRLPESETVVQGVTVNGGNIVGTDETAGSLVFRIFEPTATITVPVFQDDVVEGTENLTFNLLDGELYNVDQTASSINLSIEDGVLEPAKVVFNTNENSEISKFAYDLTGAGNTNVTASLDEQALEITDALFDNLVGFYEVINENGGIDVDGDGVADFNPGDDGYARAALENAVDGIAIRLGGNPNNDTTAAGFGDTIIEGGKQYAAFAIANAGDLSVEEFLEINPNNDAANSFDDQVAYFAFGEANPDGANHLKSLGDGIFGFEDLPSNLGASDNDFNDAVFKFNFTV